MPSHDLSPDGCLHQRVLRMAGAGTVQTNPRERRTGQTHRDDLPVQPRHLRRTQGSCRAYPGPGGGLLEKACGPAHAAARSCRRPARRNARLYPEKSGAHRLPISSGRTSQRPPTTDLVVAAVNMAERNRRPAPGVVRHSDHGSQCTSLVLDQQLQSSGIVGSMGVVGGALDYVEVFYNRHRLHSSLGYLNADEYEQRWQSAQSAAKETPHYAAEQARPLMQRHNRNGGA